jgi:hypothetical protein
MQVPLPINIFDRDETSSGRIHPSCMRLVPTPAEIVAMEARPSNNWSALKTQELKKVVQT